VSVGYSRKTMLRHVMFVRWFC